jgi:hypothetical protein
MGKTKTISTKRSNNNDENYSKNYSENEEEENEKLESTILSSIFEKIDKISIGYYEENPENLKIMFYNAKLRIELDDFEKGKIIEYGYFDPIKSVLVFQEEVDEKSNKQQRGGLGKRYEKKFKDIATMDVELSITLKKKPCTVNKIVDSTW